jgi:hypothetical protein
MQKVQKLLSLSQSDNPNEAAAALAMAQRLIAKHNLDIAEASEAGANKGSGVEIFLSNPVLSGKKIRTWQARLFNLFATANNCVAFKVNLGGVFSYNLVGTKEDKEACEKMYLYGVSEVKRLQGSHCRNCSTKYSNDFRQGVVSGIRAKVMEGIEQERKLASTTAIVLVDSRLKEAQELLRSRCKVKEEPVKVRSLEASAFNSGFHAGKSSWSGSQQTLSS